MVEKIFTSLLQKTSVCEAIEWHEDKLKKEEERLWGKHLEGLKGSILESRDYKREVEVINKQRKGLLDFHKTYCSLR